MIKIIQGDRHSKVSSIFKRKKQVTRGHNIVANRWVGACNPDPHLLPPYSHSNIQTITTAASKTRSSRRDGLTDGRTKRLIELRKCVSATKNGWLSTSSEFLCRIFKQTTQGYNIVADSMGCTHRIDPRVRD